MSQSPTIFATYSRVYPVRRATSDFDMPPATADRMARCSSSRRFESANRARRNARAASSSPVVLVAGMSPSVTRARLRSNSANRVRVGVLI